MMFVLLHLHLLAVHRPCFSGLCHVHLPKCPPHLHRCPR